MAGNSIVQVFSELKGDPIYRWGHPTSRSSFDT